MQYLAHLPPIQPSLTPLTSIAPTEVEFITQLLITVSHQTQSRLGGGCQLCLWLHCWAVHWPVSPSWLENTSQSWAIGALSKPVTPTANWWWGRFGRDPQKARETWEPELSMSEGDAQTNTFSAEGEKKISGKTLVLSIYCVHWVHLTFWGHFLEFSFFLAWKWLERF